MSPLFKAWSLILVLAAAVLGPRGAFAQTSTVVCLSSYGWMNNSLQQNPCVVASYLESVCNGGDFSISPLPPDTHYAAPTVAEANPCECSTVVYSLVSACGACQNATYLTWSSWNYNCSSVYNQQFPDSIPSGTAVPNWAYLDVTASGFSLAAAQADGDTPESTATKVQSTATVANPSSVSASLTGSSGAATGSPTTSSTKSTSSNAGAIAGGVVGGVVGAAAIIGLVTWFIVKRRRSATAPSAAFSDIGGGAGYTQSVYSPNTHSFPTQPQMTQQRLYDPSDPSTFPGSPPTPTVLTTASSNIYQNPSIPSHVFSQQSRPGQYSGTPEI
ncbi:uncharacterized protein F5147DRAFT_686203 [Suillus discolor]|uniref:Transmembrane protein n=1 Tax=Suillus discolor TaxID=1912936 RepID=A0A9P7JW19_9AGAM|nr:uncharacterized protein F5147DRAFT_686203 [Suillus discolor]KAG2111662.1 hypothetical protein F5147DRAFT_686203 [Suillus discolor]